MADLRDFRVRIDLTFPPECQKEAEQLQILAEKLSVKAININADKENMETSYVDIERCGHRLGLPCEKITHKDIKEEIKEVA
jgi:hypothetical protein